MLITLLSQTSLVGWEGVTLVNNKASNALAPKDSGTSRALIDPLTYVVAWVKFDVFLFCNGCERRNGGPLFGLIDTKRSSQKRGQLDSDEGKGSPWDSSFKTEQQDFDDTEECPCDSGAEYRWPTELEIMEAINGALFELSSLIDTEESATLNDGIISLPAE